MFQSHYLRGIIYDARTEHPTKDNKGGEIMPARGTGREQSSRSPIPDTLIERMVKKDLKRIPFRSEAEMIAYAKHYEEAKMSVLDTEIQAAIIQSIVIGIMEKHIRKAIRKFQQENIYSKEVKKNLNEINTTIHNLQKRVFHYEETVLVPLMHDYVTAVIEKYRNTGCLITHLQFEWMKAHGNTIHELFMLCLRVHEHTEHPEHANAVADIAVIDLLAQLTQALILQLAKQIPLSAKRFCSINIPDTSYCSVIHKKVHYISDRVEGKSKIRQDTPNKKLTKMVNEIGDILLNYDNILNSVVAAAKNDYFCFYVAYIMQLFQKDKFNGLIKRRVREDINYIDPSGMLYARCCKDWKRLAREVPWYDDIEDAKDAISKTAPKALFDFGKRITLRKYNIKKEDL